MSLLFEILPITNDTANMLLIVRWRNTLIRLLIPIQSASNIIVSIGRIKDESREKLIRRIFEGVEFMSGNRN